MRLLLTLELMLQGFCLALLFHLTNAMDRWGQSILRRAQGVAMRRTR